MNWSIDNFLYAIGVQELSASQIQTSVIGRECLGTIYTDSYFKTTQNKDTGLDEEVERKINRIKSLKPLNNPQTNNEDFSNLGI